MYVIFFFFNDTATTEIYTLSLHDALPILAYHILVPITIELPDLASQTGFNLTRWTEILGDPNLAKVPDRIENFGEVRRSEEHTSELQSHLNLLCRLLLEKKKNTCRSHTST